MAVKKSTSAAKKAQYTKYKANSQCVKNRTARLKRHAAKFPEDKQAAKALERSLKIARKTPGNNKTWSAAAKEYAHLLRITGSNGMIALAKPVKTD